MKRAILEDEYGVSVYLDEDPLKFKNVLARLHRSYGEQEFLDKWEQYRNEHDVSDLYEEMEVRSYVYGVKCLLKNPEAVFNFHVVDANDFMYLEKNCRLRSRVKRLIVPVEVEICDQIGHIFPQLRYVRLSRESIGLVSHPLMKGVEILDVLDFDYECMGEMCLSDTLGDILGLSFKTQDKDLALHLGAFARNCRAFEKLEDFWWEGEVSDVKGFDEMKREMGRGLRKFHVYRSGLCYGELEYLKDLMEG